MAAVTSDMRNSYSHRVVISPIVLMVFNGRYFDFIPPKEGSVALQARSLLPEGTEIVSAFHTISAASLKQMNEELQGDMLISGDGKKSKEIVISLASEIENLRPLDVGPLSISSQLESLTPLLLNVGRRNKLKRSRH
jgi:8-hydroxy-5-deazaflavin:NADPH oxidoreductase